MIVPGIHLDAVKAYESMERVKKLADIIVPIHDVENLEIQGIPQNNSN